ncbi:hypothetical protein IHA24_000642 [Salmonella enterica]|nr:hypothetical protein [Salmonella enterica]EGL9282426.1 hypothetical protein [Salmonella enterica]
MINDDILAHARQCAPAESCGYVVRTAQGERYFPCENLSAEPTMYFRISPEDYLNARNRGDIVALVHSHPDGKPCLSSADRTLTARLNESLPPGAVVHIVPRMAGAKNGIWQVVAGAALIGASFIPGLNAVAAAVLFSAGTSMALGGVAQMLTPVPKTPTVGQTDNGKQNTYFSSLENMVAQGNPVPVLYGEMKIGSRVISQMMSTPLHLSWISASL